MPLLHQMHVSGNCYKVRLAAHQLGIAITLKVSAYHEQGGRIVANVSWQLWDTILQTLGNTGISLAYALIAFCMFMILRRKQPRIYLLTRAAVHVSSWTTRTSAAMRKTYSNLDLLDDNS